MAENFYGITHAGMVRDNNEDSFIAAKNADGCIIACVIDGVGGYEGGEVAADIARSTMLEVLHKPVADYITSLQQAVLLANQNIYSEKMKGVGNNQMACVLTVALVDITNNQFYYAHVGDTRLYLLRDQSLVKVTKDHSFVGFLEDSGRLSEADAMAHPKRNEINKALGFDAQIQTSSEYIETGSSPFLPGDMLLLSSDGLTDMVNNKAMSAILNSDKTLVQKGDALIDAANAGGGKDNITAVLVLNDKKPVKLKGQKPILPKKNESPDVGVIQPTGSISTPAVTTIIKKRSNAPVMILLVICLLLAAACYWLWTRGPAAVQPVTTSPVVANANEKKLADSLRAAGSILRLYDSTWAKEILLTDTLFITQDSITIDGNGIILTADSSFKGPAFFAAAGNSYLLLQNISFKNFSTAVVANGKSIGFKQVKFDNCTDPLMRRLSLPEGRVFSGSYSDSLFIKNDSLPQ